MFSVLKRHLSAAVTGQGSSKIKVVIFKVFHPSCRRQEAAVGFSQHHFMLSRDSLPQTPHTGEHSKADTPAVGLTLTVLLHMHVSCVASPQH